jgi:hypothetical protein
MAKSVAATVLKEVCRSIPGIKWDQHEIHVEECQNLLLEHEEWRTLFISCWKNGSFAQLRQNGKILLALVLIVSLLRLWVDAFLTSVANITRRTSSSRVDNLRRAPLRTRRNASRLSRRARQASRPFQTRRRQDKSWIDIFTQTSAPTSVSSGTSRSSSESSLQDLQSVTISNSVINEIGRDYYHLTIQGKLSFVPRL